jgi:hypothetical protein
VEQERNQRIAFELARRHRASVSIIVAMLALTLLLVALAFVLAPRIAWTANAAVENVLRVLVVLIGLGAIALRRISFSPQRLRDTATLKGADGLLATLFRTSLIVAVLGGDIAIIGFIIALLTGEPFNMLLLGCAAAAVILYAYPRRAVWERVVEMAQSSNLTVTPKETAKGTIT